MADIYINPDGLYSEKDSLSSAKDALSGSMFSVDTEGLDLETVTALETLVENLNSLYSAYQAQLENDIKNLDVIIAEWMKVDTSLAGKDYWEVIGK